MPAPIHLFQPPGDNALTGGYLYNLRVCEALGDEAALETVSVRDLPDALRASRRRGAHVLVDSLYLGRELDLDAMTRARASALVHHLPTLDPGFPEGERATQAQLERRFVDAAAGVVVTSGFMRERLVEEGVAGRVEACPPGVDDDFFAVEPDEAGDPPEVITVANFEPRKGYLEFVPALARAARARAFTWHLIGDDECDPAYARRVRDAIERGGLASRTVWHGRLRRDALLYRLRRARAHVLPTRFESYGMVVAETLAAGVPMIAPRIGEIQRLVRDGETGLLSEPGDPDELAGALGAVLADDPLRESIQANLRRDRDHLPRWSDAARRLSRALEEFRYDGE